MKKLLALFALLFLPLAARAQSVNPTFNTASEAVMARFGSTMEAGTDILGTMQLTPHWGVVSRNLLFPAPGIAVNTMGGGYSGAIGKSEFGFTIDAGAGMVNSPAPMHFAADVTATLKFSPAGEPKLFVPIVEIGYWHGGVTDGAAQTSNWFTVSAGFGINLSKVF